MPIRKQVLLRFFCADKNFEAAFLVLSTKGNIFNGMPFFKEYSVTLDLKNNLVHFLEFSLKLKPHHGKFRCGSIEMKSLQKVVAGPFEQDFVPTNAATEIGTSFGITDFTRAFSQKSDVVVTPAMNQLQDL